MPPADEATIESLRNLNQILMRQRQNVYTGIGQVVVDNNKAVLTGRTDVIRGMLTVRSMEVLSQVAWRDEFAGTNEPEVIDQPPDQKPPQLDGPTVSDDA